jgi:lipoate synthase
MAIITFPKILTDRLTDEGARALADIFNTVESTAQQTTLQIAEERFEKRLAQVQAVLETKIAQSEARIIKWMFIFWVGQIGILFTFFKH